MLIPIGDQWITWGSSTERFHNSKLLLLEYSCILNHSVCNQYQQLICRLYVLVHVYLLKTATDPFAIRILQRLLWYYGKCYLWLKIIDTHDPRASLSSAKRKKVNSFPLKTWGSIFHCLYWFWRLTFAYVGATFGVIGMLYLPVPQ